MTRTGSFKLNLGWPCSHLMYCSAVRLGLSSVPAVARSALANTLLQQLLGDLPHHLPEKGTQLLSANRHDLDGLVHFHASTIAEAKLLANEPR